MKKLFIIPLILILCTGCLRVDNIENKDVIVDEIVSKKKTPNTMAMGYEYYLPIGVQKIYDKNYNQKFKCDDSFLYLYVDVVGYYYKNELNFNGEINQNDFYYKKLNNENKTGYIKISKEEDNLYYIKMIYNYAKIEAYTKEKDVNKILFNGLIILSSIDYNDNIVGKIFEDNYHLGVEKEYKINKPDDARSKFSEYLSEYAQSEDLPIEDLPEY